MGTTLRVLSLFPINRFYGYEHKRTFVCRTFLAMHLILSSWPFRILAMRIGASPANVALKKSEYGSSV